MLYQVIVLVCGMGMPSYACDRSTASAVIVSPDPQTLGMCALHGQQYFADNAPAGDESYIKIMCRPSVRIGDARTTRIV